MITNTNQVLPSPSYSDPPPPTASSFTASISPTMTESLKDSGRHFVAGGIAGWSKKKKLMNFGFLHFILGIIEVCFAHPFDCVKTRIQIGQFGGLMDCARRTIRHEGASGKVNKDQKGAS